MERIFTLNRSKGPVISCKRGWGREEGGGGKGKDGGFNEGFTGGMERGSVVAKKV